MKTEITKTIMTFADQRFEWFIKTEMPRYEITGKYLFFSADRDLLVKIAVEELERGNFHHAKIPLEGKNIGPEYMLCLYYKDDTRKNQLASKYRNVKGVRYRYWKTDEATRKGEYSKEFLQSLSPEDREHFTGKKSS